jgi:predicted TIM-barrel fold metal-dependent hydrolase
MFCHTVGLEGCDDALKLVRAFPEVTFCLDQAGMPESRDPAYFAQWRAMLAVLAAAPNVVCKISSLGMFEPAWTPASRRPWIRACIDTFGPQRCFFGSNWPIERKYSSYADVVGAFSAAISDLTDVEQEAILAGNAERIFRI